MKYLFEGNLMLQQNYWSCLFCYKEVIEILIRPSVLSAKRTAYRDCRGTF